MDDNQLNHHFLNELYSDYEGDSDFPKKRPLLAHYTSVPILEKILATDEVWLSNPLLMNDSEEIKFVILQGVPLVLEEIEKTFIDKDFAKTFKNYFEFYHNQFADNHVLDTYIFCTSEHTKDDEDGKLSMWRGYGANGNGAAIVFDTSKIKAVDNGLFVVSKVKYATKDERIVWLKSKISNFMKLLSNTEISKDKLYIPAHALYNRLKLFALFTKHNGFKEEDEWRIVYLKDRDINNKYSKMFDYFIGPRGIEPKLKLKIDALGEDSSDNLSLSTLIYKIILGPNVSSLLTKATISRMLEKHQKHDLIAKLCTSTIPYRPL